jgi:hypothetical protein
MAPPLGGLIASGSDRVERERESSGSVQREMAAVRWWDSVADLWPRRFMGDGWKDSIGQDGN